MAFTIAQTLDRDTVKQVSLISSADADTTTGAQTWVALGGTAFAVAPLFCILTPVTAAGALSTWTVTTPILAAGFTALKSAAVGSGAAGVIQCLLTFFVGSAFLAGRTALGDLATTRALAANF